MSQHSIDCWIKLGPYKLPLSLRFADTKALFVRYIADAPTVWGENRPMESIYVEDDLLLEYADVESEEIPGAWTEFYIITGLISRFLLKNHACIFHSVAFRYKGYVWLLCAPSGTGKTTQLRHWMKLVGEELSLISGDKPMISWEEDRMWVYSTPWNGKEQFLGSGDGPLGGIIYLEQADQNEIVEASVPDMVIPIMDEFLYLWETEEEIRAVAELEEKMLSEYPVWVLKNTGDEASVLLTMQKIEEYLEGRGSHGA